MTRRAKKDTVSFPVVVGKPPNYAELDALFDLEGKSILFAWRDRIYNPQGITIPSWLVEHEKAHAARQGVTEEDTERWWAKYVQDGSFRFYEELVAHRAEWVAFQAATKDRNLRAKYLDAISGRLASPLYGSLVDKQEAKRLIKGGEYVPSMFKLA